MNAASRLVAQVAQFVDHYHTLGEAALCRVATHLDIARHDLTFAEVVDIARHGDEDAIEALVQMAAFEQGRF